MWCNTKYSKQSLYFNTFLHVDITRFDYFFLLRRQIIPTMKTRKRRRRKEM